MNIYISKNHEGKPENVLLADNIEKANIAFAGMKATPYSIEEINPNESNIGVSGVVFLLTSTEVEHYIDGNFRKFRIWKRGL